MKTAVSNLTHQLVKQQKEKLVKQGTSALTDLITKNTKKSTDTTKAATQKEEIKTKAADLLNGLFKKKKKVE
jgi:ATP-dependent Zn protease